MRKAIGLLALLACSAAQAKLVRIDAEPPVPMPAKPGSAAYEKISGVFHGELDPKAPANRIITDIAKAPRNARGMVEYSASFTIARPVDPTKSSGVLFYDVPNRGTGQVEVDEDGHVRVISGWQGDIAPASGVQWAKVPTASGITGPVLARLVNAPKDAASIAIAGGIGRPTPRPTPVSLDASKAKLVVERKGRPDQIVAATDWEFADCKATPFPGKPDAGQLCVKGGFDPEAAYVLAYTGKDPLVFGVGFAATRDLIAYLRSGKVDDSGNANPAGAGIKWTVGVGNSQSGNYLRSFTNLGFNADEQGKRVFDGINPNIAARQIVLNMRFSLPGGAAGTYEPGSEGTLWWGRYNDRARGRGSSSLLDRCNVSRTCPKIVETFGSAELWGLRASPGLVGTDAKGDIPLPSNVRRYYSPSVTHAGSFRGGFPVNGEPQFMGATCLLPGNPNPSRELVRVARKWLVDWVRSSKEPPASRYPTLAAGDLVEPNDKAIGWPTIAGAPSPNGHINPLHDYDFGKSFLPRDVSGAASAQPPRLRRDLPQRVPRVNADGNEISGVPSVHLQVPIGTYTGWNVETKGFHAGENCGFAGGFIPFARTKSEREAKHDPRLSLEERYGSHEGFVAKVREVAAQEVAAGLLLPDDAARIIKEAEDSDVLKAEF